MLASPVVSGRRDPWNKGKLVGQKAPLKLRDIWAIASASSRCSIWRSTASCAAAISCNCASVMSPTVIGSLRARSSCNSKPSGRFSLRSRSRPANRSSPGFVMRPSGPRIICSRVGCGSPRICRRGNTPESSRHGSPKSAWTPTPMEPIRCAVRKLP
jgi:hypothetical protein